MFLRRNKCGETVRDLGLAGEQQKKGTPTMGGMIIILGYSNSDFALCKT